MALIPSNHSFLLNRFLLTTLLVFAGIFSMAQRQEMVASYTQVYDQDRDGRPSRCDCDYHKKSLVLKKDSTFEYQEVRGRLDPQIQLSEKGSWKIENDSLLVLTVLTTSSLFDPKEKTVTPYRKTFTIDKWGAHLKTYYHEEEWSGSGLKRTSRQPYQKRP